MNVHPSIPVSSHSLCSNRQVCVSGRRSLRQSIAATILLTMQMVLVSAFRRYMRVRPAVLAAMTLFSGLLGPFAGAQSVRSSANTPPTTLLIKVAPFELSQQRKITLQFPSNVRTETLKVELNGKDVTALFLSTSCDAGICEAGTVSVVDGLLPTNNVLSAIARLDSGDLVSNRARFEGDDQAAVQLERLNEQMRPGQIHSLSGSLTLPTGSGFLPPTIKFSSMGGGGVEAGRAWLQLGTQTQFSIGGSCSSRYSVIVLDRSTLVEKTSSPESSPQCFQSGEQLRSYFSKLNSNDLVIAGTNFGQNTDAQSATGAFNTSAIGGTSFNTSCTPTAKVACDGKSTDIPRGYVAIGVPGAAPGSVFENYYTDADSAQKNPNFSGMLVEDSSGHYNFQPAGAIEYYATPNDRAQHGNGSFTVINQPGMGKVVYLAPAPHGVGGYWLLKLSRNDLGSHPSCPGSYENGVYYVPNCGRFFATGLAGAQMAISEFNDLRNALLGPRRDELVILESVNNPTYAQNAKEAAHRFYYNPALGFVYAYYHNFATALENLGAPAMSTTWNSPDGASTLVSCIGCGNSLTGNVAWSATRNAQQGQTGAIHGLLEPDRHGLYWPVRTDQVTPGGPDTTDYSVDILNNSLPSEWPELRSTPMPGASSAAGQVAAYHYASFELITEHYIRGGSGSHRDDIHYYFTGSNGDFINYHYFYPGDLSFPGAPGSCYTWNDPVTNTTLQCFTQQDFQAVTQQLGVEVTDFTGVMNAMVSGSSNLRSIVASGTGSAAVALINAASNVMQSTLAPPDNTPLPMSMAEFATLSGKILNIGATLATGGRVPANLAENVGKTITVIGALADGSSLSEALFPPGYTPVPNPQGKFLTTIGRLSQAQLQQNLLDGFNTQLDGILGDWNRLSQIGPRTTDTGDPVFYQRNNTQQTKSVTELGLAAQRQFYVSILPTVFSVRRFGKWPTSTPTMGNVYKDWTNQEVCNPWYTRSGESTLSVSAPAYSGEPQYANWYTDGGYDDYVFAGAVENAGKKNQKFQILNSELATTLTSTNRLNLPLDELVFRNGPMASVFLDVTEDNFTNFSQSNWGFCK
jgi:hypothetical protein